MNKHSVEKMSHKTIKQVVEEFDKKFVIHCSDGEILDGMADAKKVKKWLTKSLTDFLLSQIERLEIERDKYQSFVKETNEWILTIRSKNGYQKDDTGEMDAALENLNLQSGALSAIDNEIEYYKSLIKELR